MIRSVIDTIDSIGSSLASQMLSNTTTITIADTRYITLTEKVFNTLTPLVFIIIFGTMIAYMLWSRKR